MPSTSPHPPHPVLLPALIPDFHPGSSPLLISVPHAGTGLPEDLRGRLSEAARALPDTDWFVDRLYGFAQAQGASMLIAQASRLVVDLNRPSDDQPLYTGAETHLMTGVLPMQCFSGAAVYLPGSEPSKAEMAERLQTYWQPYHQRLNQSLQEIRSQHGFAIVLDAHSIRAEVPLLFDGRLPDLNLGTNKGASAAADLIRLSADCLQASDYSLVVDGRFKGGYITRHYGQPDQQIHALQLEIAQSTYMDEGSASWNASRASPLQRHLQKLVAALSQWAPP
jgi:N-formylglutamate amidohydrolase